MMEKQISKLVLQKTSITFNVFMRLILATCLLFTIGCSSVDTSIQYYSLNAIGPHTNSSTTLKNDENKTFVIINKVELADFLNTGGLVIQIDSHQIQISNQHRWGDKLPNAIATHLINALVNSEDNTLYIEQRDVNNNNIADKRLSVEFEQFTITNQADDKLNETVISGFYHIESKGSNSNQKTFFDIRQPLTTDGYNDAVKGFENSLNTLSNQIKASLLKG